MVWSFPVYALAQSADTGAIAGVARDATGAVLPGVTVEASSPALIEKVRTAVTDAQGNYKIIDLRPGTYSVTFTLVGFSTYKRDGIELTAGFTANANADMKVGAMEETVTVTGATPIVDVQNSRAQQLIRSDVLDSLPTGSRTVLNFVNMTLGAAPSTAGLQDVGGDKGESATGILVHGGRGDDGKVNLDGMNINNFTGDSGGRMRVYYPNMVAAQEVVIDTGGALAESDSGGANQNIVPREGGNRFSAYGTANWTNHNLSTTSISDELKARGAIPFSSVKEIFDYGIGVGGPIKRDKVWFYATNRWWGAQNPGPSNFFNKSTSNWYYVPDLSQPAYGDQYYRDTSVRVTWQATGKDKVSVEEHRQDGCSCWLSIGSSGLSSPEAATDFLYRGEVLSQVTWTRIHSNKLLLQASANFLHQDVAYEGLSALNKNPFTFVTPLNPSPDAIRISEQIGFTTPAGNVIPAGYTWGALAPASNNYGPGSPDHNWNQRVSASYVTGSHAFKAGLQTLQGVHDNIGVPLSTVNQIVGRSLSYTFRGGAPVALTEYATPYSDAVRMKSMGLYAQDQWTLRKLTLNLGLRYDWFNGRAPALSLPAGPYVGARNLPELADTPNYKDITVRVGGAYDLFGNGKTAVKAFFGRYLQGQGSGLTSMVEPSAALVTSVTRTWIDANKNFVPDCNLTVLTQNGECGQVNNLAFGQSVPNITVADSARAGWNVREYNYQASVGLQHEIRPGLGVSAAFFHTWWGNLTATVNTAVTSADFTQFCVPAPGDSRLGDVSGSSICGLYDTTKFGQVNRQIVLAKDLGYGTPQEAYSGIETSVNARWGQGALVSGGLSLGRETLDFCYANAHPEVTPESFTGTATINYPRTAAYCHITGSWWNGIGSQIKGQVVYPLPYDIQVSGTFKNLPGIQQTANVTLTNAQVFPYLGRNLSAGPNATFTVAMLPVGNAANAGSGSSLLHDQRLNEVDFRITKALRFAGKRRIQGILDVYNILNARPVQAINSTYVLPAGGPWLNATGILTGRLFKLGTQIDW
ncbi:MAG TPA: carboxypeptidase regulatory-like domain-containing protein [Vicinamibacterales bacterium]|nr:carboxypeptidase regulatory-like domain-containing protein [Vicinamibacterales bacterium]